jgi:hypothetical protein
MGALKQTNVCAQSKKTNCRHPATWRDRFRCHGARRYCSLGRDRVAVVGRASGAALTARRFPPPWSVEESDIKEAGTARFFPGKQMGGNVDAQALIIWLIVGAVAGWLAGHGCHVSRLIFGGN